MIKKKIKRRKEVFQNVIFPLILGFLFFIIVFFLIISNLKVNKRRNELNQRLETLKTELQILEERKQELEAGVSQTEDADYTEKLLREKGLYKKEGEEVVVILPSEEERKEEPAEKSIWEKILGKLKWGD